MAEAGVERGFRRSLGDLIARDDDEWRLCCGSGCEPCVELLAKIVDRVREECGPTQSQPSRVNER